MRANLIAPLLISSLLGLGVVAAGSNAAEPASPPPGGGEAVHGPYNGCPPGRGHWPSAEERMQRMQEELGLSGAQAAKVKEINQRSMQSMRALRKRVHEQHRAEFEAIVDQRNTEMKKVLDDKQYQQYLDRQQRMRERMEHRWERDEKTPE